MRSNKFCGLINDLIINLLRIKFYFELDPGKQTFSYLTLRRFEEEENKQSKNKYPQKCLYILAYY